AYRRCGGGFCVAARGAGGAGRGTGGRVFKIRLCPEVQKPNSGFFSRIKGGPVPPRAPSHKTKTMGGMAERVGCRAGGRSGASSGCCDCGNKLSSGSRGKSI